MRGPEHVAAEVEHDVVALAIARRREEPGALLLLGEEVLGELDLAEILRVVERHAEPSPHDRAVETIPSDGLSSAGLTEAGHP